MTRTGLLAVIGAMAFVAAGAAYADPPADKSQSTANGTGGFIQQEMATSSHAQSGDTVADIAAGGLPTVTSSSSGSGGYAAADLYYYVAVAPKNPIDYQYGGHTIIVPLTVAYAGYSSVTPGPNPYQATATASSTVYLSGPNQDGDGNEKSTDIFQFTQQCGTGQMSSGTCGSYQGSVSFDFDALYYYKRDFNDQTIVSDYPQYLRIEIKSYAESHYGAAASSWTDPSVTFTNSADADNYSLVFASGIGNGAAADVPEAATWTMMVLGFGLTGGALRTRRRPVLVRTLRRAVGPRRR